jgi:hypothetical protein
MVVVVVVVVVVREFGKSKSRMSDLKKCRLGNLSNKGKLLWERVLDEDPVQRPEDPVDYIQDPSFQKTAPCFPTGCESVHARAPARDEWSSVTSQKRWRKNCASSS